MPAKTAAQGNTAKRKKRPQFLLHTLGVLVVVCCVFPFLLIISASLTKPIDLSMQGYKLIPPSLDTSAYETIFREPGVIVNAYGITIFSTVLTVAGGLLIMAMAAYTLARESCAFRRPLAFFFFFTMLFSGGLVPTYIWITQYLHLKNTIWVLILPSLVNVFHVIMIRTSFQKLPEALFESAKIDGASEFRIFFQIAMPLSVPVLATVAFFNAMAKWNDWSTALYYIDKQSLFPLQYMLYRIQQDIQVLLTQMNVSTSRLNPADVPGENLLMAMAIVSIGPMLVVFPFFQKYFVSGLTVGAVKG